MSRYPSGFAFEEFINQGRESAPAGPAAVAKEGPRKAVTKRVAAKVKEAKLRKVNPSLTPYSVGADLPRPTEVDLRSMVPGQGGATEVPLLGHQGQWAGAAQTQAVGGKVFPEVDPKAGMPYAKHGVQPMEDLPGYGQGKRTLAASKLARAAEGTSGVGKRRFIMGGGTVAEEAAIASLYEAAGAPAEGLLGGMSGKVAAGEVSATLAAEEGALLAGAGGKGAGAAATALAGAVGKIPKFGPGLARGVMKGARFVPGIGWALTALTVGDMLKQAMVDKPREAFRGRIEQTFGIEDRMRQELEISRAELAADQLGKTTDAAVYLEGQEALRGAAQQRDVSKLLAENMANLNQASVLSRPSLAELYAEMGA